MNQLGRDGNTPLHYACYNNHEDCIMYLLSASLRPFSRVDLGCNILQKNRSGTTPYDMCTNLSIRQKLLPFVMKATPDVSATVAPMTAPPAVVAPPTAAVPAPEPSAVPVFCHPALGRSAHHPQPMVPQPMPMPVQAPQPMPMPAPQPMPQPMPAAQTPAPAAPAPAPQPARSFGLATKGPRVVAGTGHPAMASRITRYVPSQPAHPAAHPLPTQPAARPAPAPVAAAPVPMPQPTPAPQPMPVAPMPAPQPMPQPAQPMPHALPTPLSRPKQPAQPAQPIPQPVQPAPQPTSPIFSSPSETPAFVTKPKPAKP